jgi:transposase-like protein
LLAERGIAVSYETVRRRVNHFGPMIAAQLRTRRPKPHATWHATDTSSAHRSSGDRLRQGRAVDAEGEVLDVLVQSERNKHAALKLMSKLLKKYAFVPEQLTFQERSLCVEIPLNPRRRLQHRQRPTPSHISSNAPCASRRGDDYVARGRRGRLKFRTAIPLRVGASIT